MMDLITRRRLTAAGLAGALVAASGCSTDKLLEVQTPDYVLPGSVQSVAALPAVFNSAVADFANFYDGNGTSSSYEGQIIWSGLLGDELRSTDTFPTRNEVDYRQIRTDNGNNSDVFRQLERARASAERAADGYLRLQPNSAGQSEALSLAGYVYVITAENYCSGVPFSTINPDGSLTYGQPQSTQQILALAKAKFDSALAIAKTLNNANLINLASVGAGRVLTDQGQYAAAAAAVTAVPTTYQYTIYHSENSGSENNGTWSYTQSQKRISVSDTEGTNGLAYRSDNDPRVRWVKPTGTGGTGFDGSPFFAQLKYPVRSASSVLASGVEARLIEAEAALNAGNTTQELSILNALRQNTSLYQCPTGVTYTNYTCTPPTALPNLVDPGTQTGRVQQLFKERAYWLWLTSHRLGDMRRLARTATSGLSGYGLGVNAVYPVGTYYKLGEVYHTDTSLPVPLTEQNNTNFSTCNTTNP